MLSQGGLAMTECGIRGAPHIAVFEVLGETEEAAEVSGQPPIPHPLAQNADLTRPHR